MQTPAQLVCFAGPAAANFSLQARAWRQGRELHLQFDLSGPLASLLIPPPLPAQRRDALWQQTCCECFIAEPGGTGYWEINLAPDGGWNLYSFTDRRQGMTAVATPPPDCRWQRQDRRLQLDCLFPDFPGFSADGDLIRQRCGLSAVLLEQDRRRSYWALIHPAGQPDFHDPRGFVGEV